QPSLLRFRFAAVGCAADGNGDEHRLRSVVAAALAAAACMVAAGQVQRLSRCRGFPSRPDDQSGRRAIALRLKPLTTTSIILSMSDIPASCFRQPVDPDKAYRLLNHGPTVLVSAAHGGRRNIMAAAWAMPLDFKPGKVAVVIDKSTYTRTLL